MFLEILYSLYFYLKFYLLPPISPQILLKIQSLSPPPFCYRTTSPATAHVLCNIPTLHLSITARSLWRTVKEWASFRPCFKSHPFLLNSLQLMVSPSYALSLKDRIYWLMMTRCILYYYVAKRVGNIRTGIYHSLLYLFYKTSYIPPPWTQFLPNIGLHGTWILPWLSFPF